MTYTLGGVTLQDTTNRTVKNESITLKANIDEVGSVEATSATNFLFDMFERTREITITGTVKSDSDVSSIQTFITAIEALIQVEQDVEYVYHSDTLPSPGNLNVLIKSFDWERRQEAGIFLIDYTITLIEGEV